MLTGEIRSQIDRIWDAFWSGSISNPLEVIEQITYLLFLKRLDELETAEELKANREKKAHTETLLPRRQRQQEAPLPGLSLESLQEFRATGHVHRGQ
jgi:type I restriction enzyme M protein